MTSQLALWETLPFLWSCQQKNIWHKCIEWMNECCALWHSAQRMRGRQLQHFGHVACRFIRPWCYSKNYIYTICYTIWQTLIFACWITLQKWRTASSCWCKLLTQRMLLKRSYILTLTTGIYSSALFFMRIIFAVFFTCLADLLDIQNSSLFFQISVWIETHNKLKSVIIC